MWKVRPRRLQCTECGREYYSFQQNCYTCYSVNTIKVKDEYKIKNVSDEVKSFAEVMEKRLQENAEKNDWGSGSLDFLTLKMREQQAKLMHVLRLYHMFPSEDTKRLVESECADVSNYAMMIADRVNKGDN